MGRRRRGDGRRHLNWPKLAETLNSDNPLHPVIIWQRSTLGLTRRNAFTGHLKSESCYILLASRNAYTHISMQRYHAAKLDISRNVQR